MSNPEAVTDPLIAHRSSLLRLEPANVSKAKVQLALGLPASRQESAESATAVGVNHRKFLSTELLGQLK